MGLGGSNPVELFLCVRADPSHSIPPSPEPSIIIARNYNGSDGKNWQHAGRPVPPRDTAMVLQQCGCVVVSGVNDSPPKSSCESVSVTACPGEPQENTETF